MPYFKKLTLEKSKSDIIGTTQIKLIKKGRDYIKKLEGEDINADSSAYCYLNSWSHVPGYTKLKFWQHGWLSFFKYSIINIKSILGIGYLGEYKTHFSSIENINAENVIITWCRKEDFDESDMFYDRYFKINSKDTNNEIWFLISIDNYIPQNLEKNLLIFYNENITNKFKLKYLLKIIIKEFLNNKFNFFKIFHKLSFSTVFSEIVSDAIILSIKNLNIKKACLPYEAQPLHHNIFSKLKTCNIYTIGYLHSALPPLMTDLIYRLGAPDKLFVHGNSQITILQKFLNWPIQCLEFCKSLRYRSSLIFDMNGYIFLPYDFFETSLYVRELELYLANAPINSLPKLVLRNHPHKSDSSKHNILIQKIDKLLVKYQDKLNNNNNTKRKLSLFLGATAAIIEALELGVEVIHIVTDPFFESHSDLIWDNIEVETHSKYCYSYKIKKQGEYISFGGVEDSVINLFKN